MITAISKAVVLGLSTGFFCLGTCAPSLVPLLLAEERKSLGSYMRPLVEFLFGRLLAYLFCGAIAGWLGSILLGHFTLLLEPYFYLAIGGVLMLYAFALNRSQARWCPAMFITDRVHAPFSLGMILGLNLCPPFLAALTDVFVAGNIFYGLIFFFVLFIVTSLFLLPLAVVGYLSKHEPIRLIGRWALMVSGGLYFFMGLIRLR